MKKLIFSIVMILLASTLVGAPSSLRVGYIMQMDEANFSTLFSSALDLVFSSALSEESLVALVQNREDLERKAEADKKYHDALNSEKFDTEYTLEESVSSVEEVEIKAIEKPTYFDFSTKDPLQAQHVLKTEKLDLLFVISGSSLSSLLDYTIDYYSLNSSKELVNRLAIIHKLNNEFLPIVEVLSSNFLSEYAFLQIEDAPISIKVLIDETEQIINNSLIFVKPGVHNVTFSSEAQQSYSEVIEVEKGQVLKKNIKLEDYLYPSLTLSVVPAFGLLGVQGKNPTIGEYYQESQKLPFVINGEAKGFSDINLQVNNPIVFDRIELKPEWMQKDERLKKAKDEMYKALRNTLLSFGSSVLISSLENIYPEQVLSYSAPIKLTFTSISIISLIDFIYKSSKYYHVAEQTYY